MANQNPAVSQTRSFSTVFMIEMWERFGYYGMQALIIYYMVQRLGFADERANLTWSAAAALIYVAPAIGGWIGDKVLGTRRTMLLHGGEHRFHHLDAAHPLDQGLRQRHLGA
jgi:POT family proton-dependent oligopeptide transporter